MAPTYDSDSLVRLWDELEIGVMILDRNNGKFLFVDRRTSEDIGREQENICGKHYRQIFLPEFAATFEHLISDCEDGNEHTIIYYWAEKNIWEQISARQIQWETSPALLLSFTNVSEIARLEYHFENIAYFDNLLKLPNGKKLEEDINELASVEAVTLIYFQIERFDDINNLYGWDIGDYLLQQVRDWLLASETRRAQLYRISNGFALLGRGVTLESAEDRAREIVERFRQPWLVPAAGSDHSLYCTVKLGIVYGKYIKNEMRNLLLRTIQAADQTIEPGYAIYDEKTDKKVTTTLQLQEMFIACLQNNMQGFSVYYQPIVETKTQRWTAVEALCRWTTPDGRNMPPSRFIPFAEQLGLIEQLDAWVCKTAMSQCVLLGLDKKDFRLDVNFSPTRKVGEKFVQNLLRTLKETGFPAGKLTLEITESAKMSFNEENLNGLRNLRKHGIALSLDDFGTGYSSMENLINISASILKTEKIFLDDILNDNYRQYLLRMLVNLAHYLDMQLIAEGVETMEQYALLQDYNVDYLQGFLFSPPLPLEQLEREIWRFQ